MYLDGINMIFYLFRCFLCFWGGKTVFGCFCVANLVRKDAIVVQNETKLLQCCAIFVQIAAILWFFGEGFKGGGLFRVFAGGFGDLDMKVEQVSAGFADFGLAERFFGDEGQAGNGGGSTSGQFDASGEVILVQVHAEFVEEDWFGEPAFEGAVADVEIAEGVGDRLAGFEDVDEEPELFL